jgi:hypothetical protein
VDSDNLVEYARRASQLGTCWARLDHIRRKSECLAGQVRQSKSNLKAIMLVPMSIRSAQASVICDETSLETPYWTTYSSLNMLSKNLAELCVVATSTTHRVHALGLRPLATFCGLKNITPRLCAALRILEDTTESAETQLITVEQLVDHATCCVNQLLADTCDNRHKTHKTQRWPIAGFVTHHLSYLSVCSKNKVLRTLRLRP